jgi:NADPH-dependent glutamate synthase beta subunit-like oxidoreductase
MYMKITVKSNEYPIKINMSNIPDGIDKVDIVIDQSHVQNSISETCVDVDVDPNIEIENDQHNVHVSVDTLNQIQTRSKTVVDG